MSITSTVPSAASVGAFSPEIATAQAAQGDYDPAVANALRTFATTTVADLTAIDAASQPATASTAGTVTLVTQAGAVRTVRGVVTANVADLAAFTVAGNDGLTYAAGQRVLLAAQTTATQDGIYVVGAVGGGTAPLTRAADMAAASVQPAGMEVAVNEGTLFGNTKWFATLAGANTVATSAPAFYPRKYVRVTTAMSGTPGIKALTAEWILSTSKSSVTLTVITPGTQGFLSRGTLTAGAGDGAFTVTSTANETSTLSIVIEN